MLHIVDIQAFRRLVVQPALKQIGLWSPVAECLILGTAAVESGFQGLKQQGETLGLYRMERATHDAVWKDFLSRNWELNSLARMFSTASNMPGFRRPEAEEMVWNLKYATVMCRMKYFQSPKPLPRTARIEDLAEYWKIVYDTVSGKGVCSSFVREYRRFVSPIMVIVENDIAYRGAKV